MPCGAAADRTPAATAAVNRRVLAGAEVRGMQTLGLQRPKGAVLALSKVAAREAAPLGSPSTQLRLPSDDTPMLHKRVPAATTGQKYLGTAAVPLGRIVHPRKCLRGLVPLPPRCGFVTGAPSISPAASNASERTDCHGIFFPRNNPMSGCPFHQPSKDFNLLQGPRAARRLECKRHRRAGFLC